MIFQGPTGPLPGITRLEVEKEPSPWTWTLLSLGSVNVPGVFCESIYINAAGPGVNFSPLNVKVTPRGPCCRFNINLAFGLANARVGYARSILSATSRSVQDSNRHDLRGSIN